jgi:hypothetical protein
MQTAERRKAREEAPAGAPDAGDASNGQVEAAAPATA